MALSCTRRGLNWKNIFIGMTSLECLHWNIFIQRLPREVRESPSPEVFTTEMWCLGTRCSGRRGTVGLMIDLHDLRGLFQTQWLYHSTILRISVLHCHLLWHVTFLSCEINLKCDLKKLANENCLLWVGWPMHEGSGEANRNGRKSGKSCNS